MRSVRTHAFPLAALLVASLVLTASCARRPAAEVGGGRTRVGASTTSAAGAAVFGTGAVVPCAASATEGGGGGPAGGSSGSAIRPPAGSQDNPKENLGSSVLVYFTNSTRTKPLSGTEITLGDSVFTPKDVASMQRMEMGPAPEGSPGTLVIYPDGRNGKKISLSLRTPSNPTSDSKWRVLDIAITDEHVRVMGSMAGQAGRKSFSRF